MHLSKGQVQVVKRLVFQFDIIGKDDNSHMVIIYKNMLRCPLDLQLVILSYLLDLYHTNDRKLFIAFAHDNRIVHKLKSIVKLYPPGVQTGCFIECCALGNFQLCSWLLHQFPIDDNYIRHAAEEALRNGHYQLLEWLSRKKGFDLNIDPYHDACKRGNLSLVKCIYRKLDLTKPRYVFETACACGHLRIAQWLVKSFNHTGLKLRVKHTFLQTCSSGHLLVAKWLARQFHVFDLGDINISYEDEMERCACRSFIAACARGHLIVAQWIHKELTLRRAEAEEWYNYGFRQACASGHLLLAQWVYKQLMLTRGSQNVIHLCDNYAFHKACENGHLLVAQWLQKQGQISKSDICIQVLASVCENGHLPVAQWLVNMFDFRLGRDFFFKACENGHLAVAQWVHKMLRFTKTDLQTRDYCAFSSACANGRTDVAQWLKTEFQLLVEDVRSVGLIFGKACQDGHFPIVRWLSDEFQLSLNGVQSYVDLALSFACKVGDLSFAKWLVDEFRLTERNTPNIKIILWEACKHANLSFVQWIVTTFKLDVKYVPVDVQITFMRGCGIEHLILSEFMAIEFHSSFFLLRNDDLVQ